MSTVKQIRAYREILATRHDEHLRKTYGMVPIEARYAGKCPCGRTEETWPARETVACPYRKGDKIVKFRGAWWLVVCVDRIRLDEFRAGARYVREVLTREGWKAFEWSDRAEDARHWREYESDAKERVTDRQEAGQ